MSGRGKEVWWGQGRSVGSPGRTPATRVASAVCVERVDSARLLEGVGRRCPVGRVLPRLVALVCAVAWCGLLAGCASIVLGPGSSGNPLNFVTGTLRAQRPVPLDFGPETGDAATYQETLAGSLHEAVRRALPVLRRGEVIYVASWGDRGAAGDRPAFGERNGIYRYVANEAAIALIRSGVRPVDRPTAKGRWVIPVVEADGGVTTERQYRMYGYPIYYHYEDHRIARISFVVYDPVKKRVVDVTGGRNQRIAVDSYFLDLLGVRFDY